MTKTEKSQWQELKEHVDGLRIEGFLTDGQAREVLEMTNVQVALRCMQRYANRAVLAPPTRAAPVMFGEALCNHCAAIMVKADDTSALVVALTRHLMDKAQWILHTELSDADLLASPRQGIQTFVAEARDILAVVANRATRPRLPEINPPF